MNEITLEKLQSREWRLDNLYSVKDKDGKKTIFRRNKVQKHFDENAHCKNIILKSRQVGITTFKTIDALDDALFVISRMVFNLLVGHNKEAMEEIFDEKIKFAWENLPDWLKKSWKVSSDTAKSFSFDLSGDGKHINKIAVVSSARSGSPTSIHCTELAYLDQNFPKRANEIISGGLPAIPAGEDGRFDIESTARGNGGHFESIFKAAIEREKSGKPINSSDFKAHFYNWQWDEYGLGKITEGEIKAVLPEIPPLFVKYREEKRKLDGIDLTDRELVYYYKKFLELKSGECEGDPWSVLRKEYPTTWEEAFEASAEPLFSPRAVKESKIESHPRADGQWKVAKDYVAGHAYSLGADTSEGVGGDSSTIEIIDLTANEVVAQYRSNTIPPDLFAYEIAKGGRLYGECAVSPERNNHGHATISKLREIYDENKIFQYTTKDSQKDTTTKKYGWETNASTKPRMLYELASALENGLGVNFADLAKELINYPKNKARKERITDNTTTHWDLVIAAAIAWASREFAYEVFARKKSFDNSRFYDKTGIMNF